ncbi:hypothetical protein llap_16006 [Limosa lapponica baueri]|uniref:Uncharacterized protein n=1 Tax=Limosa lapponica baueri TaxID=1758121 RepID=A0A2I0TIN7_LIMLA|nr:hypothetical protein llap_16006 [Limosa lapponica baueri]
MLAFHHACFSTAYQNDLILCTEKGVHEDQSPVLGHFALQGSLLWDPSQNITKQAEKYPGIIVLEFSISLAHFFQDVELQNIMFAAARLPLTFTLPTSSSFVMSNRLNAPLSHLIDNLHQEIVINMLT